MKKEIKYVLLRDVTKAECDWLDREFKKGETVYKYSGATYGCISWGGVACCEQPNSTPFFEMPNDALELVA